MEPRATQRTLILETLAKVAHLQHAAVNRRLAMLLAKQARLEENLHAQIGPERARRSSSGAPPAEQHEDERACIVCLDKPKTHIFAPCGHQCGCGESFTPVRDLKAEAPA